ncbi:MAG: DnaJ domain-containing protein [Candidatus Latescibacterota bacterium]|jgi:DnaJ-class molecular chaperone
MSNNDPYSVLGVSPDAEDIVIQVAYRALAQRYHPDSVEGSLGAHGSVS